MAFEKSNQSVQNQNQEAYGPKQSPEFNIAL